MATLATRGRESLSFGPFNLVASERLLMKDGAPVELGARALDILIALTSQPNVAISKRDLLARVWPDVTVEEGSLRFHIASLRKALGDGQNGARYISTLAGRGYCFVAPVSRSTDAAPAAESAFLPQANLPARLPRMVGRDADIAAVTQLLRAERFATILGAGGVGKTTVAVAVARDLLASFDDGVLFVDLGLLAAPELAGTAVASMLGLPVRDDDLAASLVAHLRDQHKLLVLDTCEHLVEAVAPLATRLFADAPRLHILATSREALRVEGEHVYRLEPLALPPDDTELSAAAARSAPAVQMFLERVAAGGGPREVSDADAVVAAEICRRLDGVALAIELAAGRVGALGLRQTAALLDQRLSLQWPGQRGAPARQKTLLATLEWSGALLSEMERAVLRRLAIFVGPFTMEAALAVVTSESIDQAAVFSAIDSLVAKSMLVTRPVGATMRYRLLDATRAYARDIALTEMAPTDLAVRHAAYYRNWLAQVSAQVPTDRVARLPLLTGLHNVRAALEWSFGRDGDLNMGIALAAAAAPLFLAMALVPEGHRWAARAIEALSEATRGSAEEQRLQGALGLSLLVVGSDRDRAQTALQRALAIAKARGDGPAQELLRPILASKAAGAADLAAATRHLAALA